jgi:hypothetical protein
VKKGIQMSTSPFACHSAPGGASGWSAVCQDSGDDSDGPPSLVCSSVSESDVPVVVVVAEEVPQPQGRCDPGEADLDAAAAEAAAAPGPDGPADELGENELKKWKALVLKAMAKDLAAEAPGKDGATLVRLIEKQLLRLGCSLWDVVSISGDGGGENEGGEKGIHALQLAEVPGYVARRCLGHIAWRVADAVIAEIANYDLVHALCGYLREGKTWSRLQALATTPELEGGLGLWRELSQEHRDMFHTAPPSIVDNRPETDRNFLAFLRGKEHILHRLCQRDLADPGRKLKEGSHAAAAILGDVLGRARRSVAAEVIHRALFLHAWVNKHGRIAGNATLEQLSDRAKGVLLDLSLDDRTLQRLGCSRDAMAAKGWEPENWVDLVALMEYDNAGLAREAMAVLHLYHLRLTTKATGHLSLVVENILRTHWLGAGVLNKDPAAARAATDALHLRVERTAPGKRSPFERWMASSPALMGQLAAFRTRAVPCRVWQGGGAYKLLFTSLAVRFLLNPDQVLDCERAHARWNWLLESKRAMRLPMLNGHLRTTAYLEANVGQLPEGEAWDQRVQDQVAAHRQALADVGADGPVARGYHHRALFLERFNLRAADACLLGLDAGAGPSRHKATYAETCSAYLRNTFVANSFYQLPGLDDSTWVFVLENKVLPGREARAEDDARARSLVVCYFERFPGGGGADEVIVARSGTSSTGMETSLATVAELALQLGYRLPHDPARSSVASERLVEEALFAIERVRYCAHELLLGGGPHVYRLLDPQNAEDAFWGGTALKDHTRLAIARRVELAYGWDRAALWRSKLGKKALEIAFKSGVRPLPAAAPGGRGPAAAAPAAGGPGGRGRGAPPADRGRGRGRGRGARGRRGGVLRPPAGPGGGPGIRG